MRKGEARGQRTCDQEITTKRTAALRPSRNKHRQPRLYHRLSQPSRATANARDTAPRHTTKARVGSAATNNAAMPSSGRRSQWMAKGEESRVARVCVSMCQRKLHTPRPHTVRTSHTTRTHTRSFCGRSVNADSWGRAASRRLRGALPTRLRAQCAANRRRQNQLAQRSHERNARHPQHGAPKHK